MTDSTANVPVLTASLFGAAACGFESANADSDRPKSFRLHDDNTGASLVPTPTLPRKGGANTFNKYCRS